MGEYGDHESTEDPVHMLRHSTAHLLAAAVTELYPDAKYGIGPPVEDGFYYDFAFTKPITEADLGPIESRMRRIAQEGRPFVHETMNREQALGEFRNRGHKKLGKELKLFTVDERVGAGLPLWLPAGATIRRELERFIVDEELSRGYLHVRTPDVARLDLYRQSGHAQLYGENMYPPMRFEDGEELELRPVNCPHHIVVYQSELRSYRDLPMRIAEIGNNWRYERSGTLIGLNRVRAFALNDAHIFCTPEQLMDEVKGAIDLALYFSDVLGIEDWSYRLSTRDAVKEKWLGVEEQWERAQKALAEALKAMDQTYEVGVGEAAFYGPKIDFQVKDVHRREFTNSTVQIDFQLPERFGLEYVAEDGSRQRPVMVHRGAAAAVEPVVRYLLE